jgi:hypothetical protein
MELARIATQATFALEQVALKRPELLFPYSRLRHGWPIIKMKREAPSKKERELFAAIQLGADSKIAAR